MKKAILILHTGIFFLSIWWLISCTYSVSGGSGTETINTYALLPDGTPAQGAHVNVIDAHGWIDSVQKGVSPVLGSGITDNNGYCSITIPVRKGTVNLQIDHCANGLLFPLSAEYQPDIDTVYLEKYASVSGTFTNYNSDLDSAFLYGTSYKIGGFSNGLFSFSAIPPGSFALLNMHNNASGNTVVVNSSFSIKAGENVSLGTIESGEKRLLVDNFECGVGPTSLASIIPELGWYVLSDSLYYYWDTNQKIWKKGTSTVIGNSIVAVDSLVNGINRTSFTYSTILDTISPKANAVAGISFKPLAPHGIDLSKMKEFSFKASGKGVIGIRFETERLDTINHGLSHYTYPVVLSEEPAEYRIPVDSLRILPTIYKAENYSWLTESRNVMRIEFNFSTMENKTGKKLILNLDDFYLEGVSLSVITGNNHK